MPRTKKAARRGQRKAQKDEYRTDLLTKGDMKNARFEAYYAAQHIVADDEWDVFLDTLRTYLPTTFRITGSRQTACELKQTIEKTYVPLLSHVVFEDERVPPPIQIPWYPEGLAWQFNVPKKVLRKSAEFKTFHSFLVFETEVGNISRQEAVSMLPPLLLDVKPHHHVLDMCAAPGSKTAQILEALHANDTSTSTSFPPGLLIANDSDHKRTQLLIHQSARLPSPAFMVTNLDASIYPTLRIPASGTSQKGVLLFDRILCDVPCSGDGTLRKNPGIWKSWQIGDGNGLHGLQLRILQRAMKMLKDDGRIVYSTCSLNPVENEAVIAAALKSNTEFRLVDVSTQLPNLAHRPGLTSWKPGVGKGVIKMFDTYAKYITTLSEAQKVESKMTEAHWPPPDAKELHLDRCMRIHPHLQDTGGFFVAVLQKVVPEDSGVVRSLKREIRNPTNVPEPKKPRLDNHFETSLAEAAGNSTSPTEEASALPQCKGKAKEPGAAIFGEHPYTFLAHDDPILLSSKEKLNLTSSFPFSNVLVRNPSGEPARSLYLTNDIVKTVVLHNDYTRIRLTSCGTKVFVKQEGGKSAVPQFRTLGEGLPVVLPFLEPSCIMEGSLQALKTLVEAYYPLTSAFEGPFRKDIENRELGSLVARFKAGKLEDAVLTHDIYLPLWKSNVSVTLMIDKRAKSALSMRLFGEDITTSSRDATRKKNIMASVEPTQPEDDEMEQDENTET